MATVTSLTETKIRELMAGWEGLSLTQDEINTLLAQVLARQDAVDASLGDFNANVLPDILADLTTAADNVSNINETLIPDLEAAFDLANQQITNLYDVDIPTIQARLDSEIENSRVAPKVFVQPEPPEEYDDLEDRDLVVGDTWYDSDDDNKQHIWDGVQWTTFAVDVANIYALIEEYLAPNHAIFTSPVDGSIATTNGTNITPTP